MSGNGESENFMGAVTLDSKDSFEIKESPETKDASMVEEEQKYEEELRISTILKELLDQHKAQSLIVQGLHEELNHLEHNPLQFFQTRKKFLYHAYTQTMKDCSAQTNFDVKLDAGYAITDKEVGLVFGHIYQVNPKDALEDDFTFEHAAEIDREAAARVAEWQKIEGLPEGHSSSLLDIGKRVLKGHVGVLKTASAVTVADTEHLVIQAKELQKEEERLKTTFPTATKVMDPDDGRSTNSEGKKSSNSQGTGDESESSGVLVDKDDFGASQEDLIGEEATEGVGQTSKETNNAGVPSSEGTTSKLGMDDKSKSG